MIDTHIVRVGIALADPTRLRLVRVLEEGGPIPMGLLVDRLQVARSTLHHHLCLLEAASMVVTEQVGRRRYPRLQAGPWEALLRQPGRPFQERG